MRRTRHLACAVLIVLSMVSNAYAATIKLDFEGLSDLTVLTTQYSGLTFSNAIVLEAGLSLNETELPPASGTKAVMDDGGLMSIAFANPISSFSGLFTYATQVTINAFDSGNNLLSSTQSIFESNLAISGDAGSTANELMQLTVAGIKLITIIGNAEGASFALDDVTYIESESNPDPEPVPEPASVLLVVTGVLALAKRRTQRRNVA